MDETIGNIHWMFDTSKELLNIFRCNNGVSAILFKVTPLLEISIEVFMSEII